MQSLRILHETRYDYDRQVEFGPWRLMLRPTDTHALRVVSANLEFSPAGRTWWSYDAFGNSVCHLDTLAPSNSLVVTSTLAVDRFPASLNGETLIESRIGFPIMYRASDRIALSPFLIPTAGYDDGPLRNWILNNLPSQPLSAADLLRQLSSMIHSQLTYTVRNEEGVQSPIDTLQRGTGACRDYAWLMIEAARHLGFAARFVSGYLYSPGDGLTGGGSTHAWCEIFLPELGWVEFDPTNQLEESGALIHVNSTRTPEEASPMQGSILGEAQSTLTVNVQVQDAALIASTSAA